MANIKRNKPKTHLVIPDSHAHPDHNNNRFDWLGKLILDIKPDVVINIGDMADMPSLCSYDYGKKGYEGRRYLKDIESAREADDRIWLPVRGAKKKLPRRVFCLGNHEERINRATEADAKLDGVLSIDDLGYDRNWEVYPFLESVEIDGINYCHYFTSGVMGRPIAGEHPAYSLLTKRFSSCTQGHTHTRDFAQRNRPDGQHILGMVVGCYLDYYADYAGPANDMWWRGVVIKREVQNGYYEPQFIDLDTLRREYGGRH